MGVQSKIERHIESQRRRLERLDRVRRVLQLHQRKRELLTRMRRYRSEAVALQKSGLIKSSAAQRDGSFSAILPKMLSDLRGRARRVESQYRRVCRELHEMTQAGRDSEDEYRLALFKSNPSLLRQEMGKVRETIRIHEHMRDILKKKRA